ncbi:MAG TPA: oxidoreductase [Acidimicrobiales bacterium]
MGEWTVDDLPDQSGRTVLVTGANSGLGVRTAEALAAKGAHVLLACRNEARAAAARDLVAAAATGPEPTVVPLDLADLSSVRRAAAEVDGTVDRLDVLVNNAGVMAIPQARTADGFEMQFGTNHLGHFALTGLLLPALRRAAAPRVVTTSSNGHKLGRVDFDDLHAERKRYAKWRAYTQSKLANLLFALELDRRARAAGWDLVSVAAHPGYASTHLTDNSGGRVWRLAVALGDRVLSQSDAAGALPQLYAATMPDVLGGQYYGPDGFLELRGAPTLARPTRAARDETTARRLWVCSEEATKVTYDFA